MKTEMNYEQKYKKVLEQAKQAIEDIPDKSLISCKSFISWLENIFPELRESEDKRIRRFLINFNNGCYTKPSEEEVDSWLKWLEKQGEQNSSWSEKDEYQVNTILHGLDLKRELYKKEGNKVEEERYNTQYNWLKSIKLKSHWKPSDEQMQALNAINNIGELSYIGQSDLLIKLYNDLKNL